MKSGFVSSELVDLGGHTFSPPMWSSKPLAKITFSICVRQVYNCSCQALLEEYGWASAWDCVIVDEGGVSVCNPDDWAVVVMIKVWITKKYEIF